MSPAKSSTATAASAPGIDGQRPSHAHAVLASHQRHDCGTAEDHIRKVQKYVDLVVYKREKRDPVCSEYDLFTATLHRMASEGRAWPLQ
jgi:hypothetical protein